MKHLHVLGISGTFMSGMSILAREAGFTVSGADANCYPPVSDLLQAHDIAWIEGYDSTEDALKADEVIIGNAIKRGMPVLEAVMASGASYTSGPQWLAENILSRYKVIAVAGTHGKTTTTSMIAWILHEAGLNPGFLIGGVAPNFNTSARLGSGEWFVIEADEYDSAFFDKRPKFMHYRPRIAVLNNLEFDHADIYADLPAIQQQFHYLLRTIPENGMVLKPRHDAALNEVITKGVYSGLEDLAVGGEADWSARLLSESGSAFEVLYRNDVVATVEWPLIGRFNVENGLAAIAAAFQAGVDPQTAAMALQTFKPVKRRLEVRAEVNGITVYDDFAHHPTAIAKTIEALKKSQRHQRILAVMEFASYTMRTGVHSDQIKHALAQVDAAYILEPKDFDLRKALVGSVIEYSLFEDTDAIVKTIARDARAGDAVLVMSNRGFNGIHNQLGKALAGASYSAKAVE